MSNRVHLIAVSSSILFSVLAALPCLDLHAEAIVFTNVVDTSRVGDEFCHMPIPFDFTGQILTSGTTHPYFKDATGGLCLHGPGIPAEFPQYGIVRVRGLMSITPNGEKDFFTESMEIIRKGEPAKAISSSCSKINSGEMDFRIVSVQGVVSSVVLDEIDPRFIWLSFRDTTGRLFITCYSRSYDIGHLRELIDAEVSITGLVAPLSGLRHNLGRNLFIGNNPNCFTVIKPPPKDPFCSPPLLNADVIHRQRVRGVVLGISNDRFFIRTLSSRIIPVLPTEGIKIPEPGTSISAVGFATFGPYRIFLSNALVQIEDSLPSPTDTPMRKTMRELFMGTGRRKHINVSDNASLVTLRGTATRLEDGKLILSSDGFSVSVDLAVLLKHAGAIPPNGSTIEASGLCLAEFDSSNHADIYPTFRRFTLYPRSLTDIHVLSLPSWWTPFRLMILVIALAAVLLGSGIWNFMLKRRSEKRGKELYEEKIDHALAEQKVEERTRLAVELHDSLSQTLTGVALQLEGGETETAKKMLAACRGELRRCLWDLRSRTFEEKDMTEAIERTIAPHAVGAEIAVRFNVPRVQLSESTTHAVLRIVRELVVNAIRHGNAKHIKVAGEQHDSILSFSVADDGTGFDPATAPGPEQGHFGLLGVRERIEEFNGELKVTGSPGAGTRFVVKLKMEDNEDERQA